MLISIDALLDVPRKALRYLWPDRLIEKVLLAATLAWGCVLRVMFLHEPIRFDEASNALYYADRSFLHALAGGAGNDNHVLNSVLMWFSVRLFGWSEATVRLPALVFGLLLVWSTFAFLRWYTRDGAVALTGAAFVAVSPWLIYFSVNGRGYIHQAVMLSLLTPVVMVGLQDRGENSFSLGVWAGLLSALGAFCVRSMSLFVGALLLPCGLLTLCGPSFVCPSGGAPAEMRGPRTRFLITWTTTMLLLVAALLGPPAALKGFSSLGGGLAGYGKQTLPVALSTTAWSFRALISLLLASDRNWVPWAGCVVLFLGVASMWKRARLLLIFMISLVVCGFLATPLLGFGLIPRFLVPGTVFVICALCLGLMRLLPHRYRWAAFPAVLLVYPLCLTSPDVFHRIRDTGHIPGAREAARLLLECEGIPKSLVVVTPNGYTNGVAFYFREAGLRQHNFATGYLKVREPEKLCDFHQAAVFLAGSTGEPTDLRTALEKFSMEPWCARADLNQSFIVVSGDTVGAVVRVPLRECSEAVARETRFPVVAFARPGSGTPCGEWVFVGKALRAAKQMTQRGRAAVEPE